MIYSGNDGLNSYFEIRVHLAFSLYAHLALSTCSVL